ncbi:MAG: thiol-disulfide oxidoreductase, partial [Flavobacteriia bacterium]
AERGDEIFFSSLQSPFAQQFFIDNNAPPPDLSTFYLYRDHHFYSRSTAALALFPILKWPDRIMNIFRIIPVCQRDQLYNFIAKRRKWFMSKRCVLPTNEQRKRFLNKIGD